MKTDPEKNWLKTHLDSLGSIDGIKETRVEKIAFGIFLASPEEVRGHQKDFSKQWNISQNTLTVWKQDPQVLAVRTQFLTPLILENTPEVILHLLKATKTRNKITGLYDTKAIELWFKYVEKWREEEAENGNQNGIMVNFMGSPSPYIDGVNELQKRLDHGKPE